MDLNNIQDQLNTEFAKSDTRIVFWFDDKGEYEDEISELQLHNAKLHILDGTNWFYSKWLLNESDTENRYLVYAPFPKPSDAEKKIVKNSLSLLKNAFDGKGEREQMRNYRCRGTAETIKT